MLRRILYFFLPKGVDIDNPEIRSHRIFIMVLLISAIGDLMNIPTVNQIELPVVAELLFINSMVNIILLILYKYGLSLRLAAHLSIGQHAISFIIQGYYQGGVDSPALASMYLIPAVIILLLGKKDAIVWFVISLLIIIGFYIYESQNGPLPEQFLASEQIRFYATSVLAMNIVIFVILLVYENTKNRAVKIIKQRHDDLVATQKRLVQSEKLASLGELTAGIAHEIQNPLNFVNNFSELSVELAEELQEEFKKLDIKGEDAEYLEQLLSDIVSNQQKINHHGKRADGIVKGMLRHSRGSSGEMELTDINEIADEYLRLAYHGLRAKDKSFNVTMHTDFDENLGKIKAVPQDIGRVILNIITNAFYAVDEKAKKSTTGEYAPAVWLSTKKTGNKVHITIRDNGDGIPGEIIDKIFQPFFTTKSTGKGTGLGLSMAYDIITKVHGGELHVTTEAGEFTEFLIDLNV